MQYTHDHMIFTLMSMYPHLSHWKDYKVAMPCTEGGGQCGDPWIVEWTAPDTKPRAEWVLDHYHENQEAICAALARHQRDDRLKYSDPFAFLPSDANEYVTARHAAIIDYRSKLRDIEALPGWPLDVQFPDFPG